MSYKSKFTGAEVDDLLQKVKDGGSVTVDTELSETSMNPLANATVTAELKKKVNAEFGKGLSTNDFTDDDKKKLLGLLTIESLSDAEVLKTAFEKHHFADRLNVPIPCFIKEESHDEAYQSVILIVEKYPHDGYKLNFINIGATSQFKLYDENGVEIEDVYDQEWQWSPKCKLINGTCDSYLIPNNGYVIHLGKGELVIADDKLDASSDRPISNKALCDALIDTKLFELVRILPAKGKAGKVYLVVNENGPNDNSLIEWIWINERWEKLGEFKADVDLSEYAKKIYVDQAIAKIPAPESSVFEAEYNKTTFAEIVEAYNAGKSVTCRYGQTIAQLISITDSVIYFTSINIKNETRFICYPSNIWNYNSHNTAHELEDLDNGNVQVTIAGNSAEVATPAYVSDAIASAITNVLNEEV